MAPHSVLYSTNAAPLSASATRSRDQTTWLTFSSSRHRACSLIMNVMTSKVLKRPSSARRKIQQETFSPHVRYNYSLKCLVNTCINVRSTSSNLLPILFSKNERRKPCCGCSVVECGYRAERLTWSNNSSFQTYCIIVASTCRVTWGKAPPFGDDLSLTYLFASTSEKSYMYVTNYMLCV